MLDDITTEDDARYRRWAETLGTGVMAAVMLVVTAFVLGGVVGLLLLGWGVLLGAIARLLAGG